MRWATATSSCAIRICIPARRRCSISRACQPAVRAPCRQSKWSITCAAATPRKIPRPTARCARVSRQPRAGAPFSATWSIPRRCSSVHRARRSTRRPHSTGAPPTTPLQSHRLPGSACSMWVATTVCCTLSTPRQARRYMPSCRMPRSCVALQSSPTRNSTIDTLWMVTWPLPTSGTAQLGGQCLSGPWVAAARAFSRWTSPTP